MKPLPDGLCWLEEALQGPGLVPLLVPAEYGGDLALVAAAAALADPGCTARRAVELDQVREAWGPLGHPGIPRPAVPDPTALPLRRIDATHLAGEAELVLSPDQFNMRYGRFAELSGALAQELATTLIELIDNVRLHASEPGTQAPAFVAIRSRAERGGLEVVVADPGVTFARSAAGRARLADGAGTLLDLAVGGTLSTKSDPAERQEDRGLRFLASLARSGGELTIWSGGERIDVRRDSPDALRSTITPFPGTVVRLVLRPGTVAGPGAPRRLGPPATATPRRTGGKRRLELGNIHGLPAQEVRRAVAEGVAPLRGQGTWLVLDFGGVSRRRTNLATVLDELATLLGTGRHRTVRVLGVNVPRDLGAALSTGSAAGGLLARIGPWIWFDDESAGLHVAADQPPDVREGLAAGYLASSPGAAPEPGGGGSSPRPRYALSGTGRVSPDEVEWVRRWAFEDHFLRWARAPGSGEPIRIEGAFRRADDDHARARAEHFAIRRIRRHPTIVDRVERELLHRVLARRWRPDLVVAVSQPSRWLAEAVGNRLGVAVASFEEVATGATPVNRDVLLVTDAIATGRNFGAVTGLVERRGGRVVGRLGVARVPLVEDDSSLQVPDLEVLVNHPVRPGRRETPIIPIDPRTNEPSGTGVAGLDPLLADGAAVRFLEQVAPLRVEHTRGHRHRDYTVPYPRVFGAFEEHIVAWATMAAGLPDGAPGRLEVRVPDFPDAESIRRRLDDLLSHRQGPRIAAHLVLCPVVETGRTLRRLAAAVGRSQQGDRPRLLVVVLVNHGGLIPLAETLRSMGLDPQADALLIVDLPRPTWNPRECPRCSDIEEVASQPECAGASEVRDLRDRLRRRLPYPIDPEGTGAADRSWSAPSQPLLGVKSRDGRYAELLATSERRTGQAGTWTELCRVTEDERDAPLARESLTLGLRQLSAILANAPGMQQEAEARLKTLLAGSPTERFPELCVALLQCPALLLDPVVSVLAERAVPWLEDERVFGTLLILVRRLLRAGGRLPDPEDAWWETLRSRASAAAPGQGSTLPLAVTRLEALIRGGTEPDVRHILRVMVDVFGIGQPHHYGLHDGARGAAHRLAEFRGSEDAELRDCRTLETVARLVFAAADALRRHNPALKWEDAGLSRMQEVADLASRWREPGADRAGLAGSALAFIRAIGQTREGTLRQTFREATLEAKDVQALVGGGPGDEPAPPCDSDDEATVPKRVLVIDRESLVALTQHLRKNAEDYAGGIADVRYTTDPTHWIVTLVDRGQSNLELGAIPRHERTARALGGRLEVETASAGGAGNRVTLRLPLVR